MAGYQPSKPWIALYEMDKPRSQGGEAQTVDHFFCCQAHMDRCIREKPYGKEIQEKIDNGMLEVGNTDENGGDGDQMCSLCLRQLDDKGDKRIELHLGGDEIDAIRDTLASTLKALRSAWPKVEDHILYRADEALRGAKYGV